MALSTYSYVYHILDEIEFVLMHDEEIICKIQMTHEYNILVLVLVSAVVLCQRPDLKK